MQSSWDNIGNGGTDVNRRKNRTFCCCIIVTSHVKFGPVTTKAAIRNILTEAGELLSRMKAMINSAAIIKRPDTCAAYAPAKIISRNHES
jgi:hypothetical protein